MRVVTVKSTEVKAILSRLYCVKCDVEMQPVHDSRTQAHEYRYGCPVCGIIETLDISYPALRVGDGGQDGDTT